MCQVFSGIKYFLFSVSADPAALKNAFTRYTLYKLCLYQYSLYQLIYWIYILAVTTDQLAAVTTDQLADNKCGLKWTFRFGISIFLLLYSVICQCKMLCWEIPMCSVFVKRCLLLGGYRSERFYVSSIAWGGSILMF